MRLQSYDEFATVARFRPMDGDFVEMLREEASGFLDEPLGGHFSWSLGPLIMLYRSGDGLRLRVGHSDQRLDQTLVEWSSTESDARLALNTPSGVQVFEYRAATVFGFDFSAGVEDEHLDFGLFVANVVADDARAARLYRDVEGG